MLALELRFILVRSLARSRPSSTARPLSTSSALVRPLTILGLESSADDTCASIVTSERKIISNVVLRQHGIHEDFGGIHPLYAQEAHQRGMPLAIKAALEEAGLALGDLDGIAFTRGPGMYGCLSCCSGAAKALAAATGLPLLGVHHMQAHALTPFLTEEVPPSFPFLTLLVSGGHTLLLLARSESSFQVLATTHDESIGAAIDKASRALAIPWSLGAGSPGAALEAFASLTSSPPPWPSALPFRNELSFSFAGTRSALTRILAKESEMGEERKREVARGFMGAAVAQVEEKIGLAIEWWEGRGEEQKLGGLVVSGGVASNQFLRRRLREKLDGMGHKDLRLIFPPPHLCTDNAAMIASVGISRLQRGRVDEITVMQKAKWSIEECEADFEQKVESS